MGLCIISTELLIIIKFSYGLFPKSMPTNVRNCKFFSLRRGAWPLTPATLLQSCTCSALCTSSCSVSGARCSLCLGADVARWRCTAYVFHYLRRREYHDIRATQPRSPAVTARPLVGAAVPPDVSVSSAAATASGKKHE